MPPAFLVASRLGDMEHCRFATHWLNSEFHYTVCTDVAGRTFGCCLLQMAVDLDGLRPDSVQIDNQSTARSSLQDVDTGTIHGFGLDCETGTGWGNMGMCNVVEAQKNV